MSLEYLDLSRLYFDVLLALADTRSCKPIRIARADYGMLYASRTDIREYLDTTLGYANSAEDVVEILRKHNLALW